LASPESGIWTVAVVGCGIGRAHIEGYRSHPDKFRVAALCDVDEKRLAAAGDEFSIVRRTTSFDELLLMEDIEIVAICSPPALHVSQIIAALAGGKEVVCEKPLAGSLADVDRVIAAEHDAPGRVMPIFQYRFGNGVQKAKQIIDTGVAGKPYLATVETAWRRTPEYYRIPWRGRLASELGGVLLSQAIHSHDLMTYLMEPVASVFARLATRVNPVEVEDCAVASLAMHSGALAALAATLGSHNEISRLRFCFEHVTFESSHAAYSPGDEPWEIFPASKEIADRSATHWPITGCARPGSRG
jgi:predicted dehydrogenase